MEFEYEHECGDGVWRFRFVMRRDPKPSFQCVMCGEVFTFSGVNERTYNNKDEKK